MINYKEFTEQMSRLGSLFYPLDDDAMLEYYNSLKFFESEELKEAIDILKEEHGDKSFPLIKHILGAINEIRRQASYSYPDEETPVPICKECEGTGFETWYGVDGRFKAKPCTHCEKGQRIAEGWRAHFKKVYNRELIKNKEPKESGEVPF
jgi:hypothetical protein